MTTTNTPGPERRPRPPRDDAAPSRTSAGTPGKTRSGSITDRAAQATMLLRQHTDAGWKAIEDTVIARAMALYRPSAPIRGRHALGDFLVASDALVAHLRRAVDAIPQAAAQRITCVTAERDQLESVTIAIIAAYGTPLVDLAARVHATTWEQLQDLLGALAPVAENIHTHVHIGDVSKDPRIVA